MARSAELTTLLAAFDVARDGWMLCEAVRDDAGQIEDFAFTYVNAAAATALRSTREAMLAGTQRQLFPAVTENGLFEAFLDVAINRRVWSRSIFYDDGRLSGSYDLTMTPYGDGFLTCLVQGSSDAGDPSASGTRVVEADSDTDTDTDTDTDADTVDVYLLVNPLRDRTGAVVDFLIEDMNETTTADAGGADARGRRVSEVFPSSLAEGWFDAYRRVLEADGPVEMERTYSDDRFGGVYSLRMQMVGDRLEVRGRNLTAEGEAAFGQSAPGRALVAHVVLSALAAAVTIEEIVEVLLDRAREAAAAPAAAVVLAQHADVRGVEGADATTVIRALREVWRSGVRGQADTGDLHWALFPIPGQNGEQRTRGAWALAFRNWRDDRRIDVLSAIAAQAGVALDRATLHERQLDLGVQLEFERLTLRIVLDSLEEGVVACDRTGRITVSNAAARHLIGDEQAVQTALADLLAGGVVQEREISDDERVLLATGRRLEGTTSDVLGAVVALRDVTERKRFERELWLRGLHDPLTGLANRALLTERLDHALALLKREGLATSVLLMDLDRFKVVNDSLGHTVGDRLLVEVSRRLSACAREVDLLARLGGDEFVFVMDGDESTAQQVWERISGSLSIPIELEDGQSLVMEASGGVAVAGMDDHAEDVLRKADQAMYWAKQRRRGTLAVFDEGMAARARRRVEVEQEIRTALAEDRVRAAWQPIVELSSGRSTGAEALLRLDRGAEPPAEPEDFLDVAEDSGLIHALGQRLLENVLTDLRTFRRAGIPPLDIHVNLCARELASDATSDAVVALAERVAVEGLGGLTIEVTENGLLGLGPALDETIGRFRAAGVRLAIDDFGTGWSSMTYLRRLSLDCVKIDRSFVGGVGTIDSDRQIVAAVAGLATSLRLDSVAEGVESLEQHQGVRALGCTYAQGYLFGRPAPAEEFLRRWVPVQTPRGPG